MLNSVVQRARALMAAPGRRFGQFALAAPAVPAIKDGGLVLAVAAVLLVVLLAGVAWSAIWAGEDRRKAALEVLDRLLRWKG